MPWITPDGSYYDGKGPVADGSVEVSDRPSKFHDWSNGEWILNVAAQKLEIVPQKVTMRQARIVLRRHNLLGQVTAAVNSMQGTAGDDAKIEWEFSSEVKRQQPLTLALAASIGLTVQEMDDLFIEAASL